MEAYLPWALLAILVACFIAQLYYLLYYHRRLTVYSTDGEQEQGTIPISIIISARNEEQNLKNNLPSVLEQDYPDFEVVVVNDCSLDETEEVLKEMAARYPRLKIVQVTENDRFKTGKKFALTMGIKAAKNEHLLFTDADCRPASANWIARIAANFTGDTEIILGYSPYERTGGLLNSFIRFETVRTAIYYLSAALAGNPYMGIGRNLAYTKTLFFKNKGFASHMHVMSGDDDLFVNENATASNTTIVIHPEAFTYSPAKASIGALYKQKRRHMGVGKMYKNKHRRLLSFDALTGFFFYTFFVLCLLYSPYLFVALGLLLLRTITQIILYYKIFRKLDAKNLIWYLPVFDLVYYVYLNIFGLIGTFIKTTQWK